MEKNDQDRAIALFEKYYEVTPSQKGVPVIDIYRGLFLYAASNEVLEACKKSQDILRFMMMYFMWPLVGIVILFFVGLSEGNAMSSLCLFSYVFFVLWGILFIVLLIKYNKANKQVMVGENLFFLNCLDTFADCNPDNKNTVPV